MIINGLIRTFTRSSSPLKSSMSSMLSSSSSFSLLSFLPLRVLVATTAITKSSESFCLSSRISPSPSSLPPPYLSIRNFYTRTYFSSSLLSSSSSETTTTTTTPISEYWNREESSTFRSSAYSACSVVKKEARIVSLSPLNGNDPNNIPLEHPNDEPLPEGAIVLGVLGNNLDKSDIEYLKKEKCNVIFVSPGITNSTLATLIHELKDSLEWIHSRSAGIDVLLSNTLKNSSTSSNGSSNSKSTIEDSKAGKSSSGFIMTNSKGIFSSTLAEYTMMACSYFAKDLPQLLKNKSNSKWKKYNVLELRGSTIGK